MSWHERARRALKSRGYRYNDLAEAFGGEITVGAIGHKLRGRSPTTVDEFKVISEFCGVSASALLGQPGALVNDPDERNILGLYRRMTKEEKRELLDFALSVIERNNP